MGQWTEELFSGFEQWCCAGPTLPFLFMDFFCSIGCVFQQMITDLWKLGYWAFQRVGHHTKMENGWLTGETLHWGSASLVSVHSLASVFYGNLRISQFSLLLFPICKTIIILLAYFLWWQPNVNDIEGTEEWIQMINTTQNFCTDVIVWLRQLSVMLSECHTISLWMSNC